MFVTLVASRMSFCLKRQFSDQLIAPLRSRRVGGCPRLSLQAPFWLCGTRGSSGGKMGMWWAGKSLSGWEELFWRGMGSVGEAGRMDGERHEDQA